MSRLSSNTQYALYSFGINSVSSMVAKARRELTRCINARDDDDQRDAALNCAVTIWHINDWLYQSINSRAHAQYKPHAKNLFGATGVDINKSDIDKWAISSCLDLEYCQSICNGIKHVTSSRQISGTHTIMDAPASATDEELTLSKLLIIDATGARIELVPTLTKALEFWETETNRGPVF